MYRGRIVWELLARPSLEHVSEVWLTGGQIGRRKLRVSSDESEWEEVC